MGEAAPATRPSALEEKTLTAESEVQTTTVPEEQTETVKGPQARLSSWLARLSAAARDEENKELIENIDTYITKYIRVLTDPDTPMYELDTIISYIANVTGSDTDLVRSRIEPLGYVAPSWE